jgi:hypothetical protein
MNLTKLNKRDYPKLQKERVLRNNPPASLHAFGKKLDGDKLAEKYRKAVGGTYVKRERAPNEALPRTGDWRSSVYDPNEIESRVGLARYT